MATNPSNPVVWFEIYVDDFNRAIKFYETVFETSLSAMPDPSNQGLQMASFPLKENAPNATGALIKMEGVKAGGNSTIVYFSCEDCSIQEKRVVKSDGSIEKKFFHRGVWLYLFCCRY